jgi:ribose transport system substrate-binding protein
MIWRGTKINSSNNAARPTLISYSFAVALLVGLVSLMLVACGDKEEDNGGATGDVKGVYQNLDPAREYYLVSSHQAHPYFNDSHIGLRYAAEYFNVKITAVGPDAWDTSAQAQAFEQTLAKKPAGIISRGYDSSSVDASIRAQNAGIPVVITESKPVEGRGTVVEGSLTFIGLDNYQCGADTAKELIERAGDTGVVGIMGNWGASNTDAKLQGIKDYLEENAPGWSVCGEADDKATTNDAIIAAKSLINNYPEMTAILGIDSSSGSGIANAMQELNIEKGQYKVVVHDREPATLQFIEEGYIDATLINKTAGQEFVAMLVLEDWNNGGLKNMPISSDNAAAGVNPVPDNMINTAVVIDADNVQYFTTDAMPDQQTDLYNR